MKRTIEIEDNLEEIVQCVCDDVGRLLRKYIAENSPDRLPCLNDDLDYSGRVQEIIDGSVPVYYSELDDLWFLYSDLFEQAYENAGYGDNPRENHGMSAIYCYISERVGEWYSENAQSIFESYVKA